MPDSIYLVIMIVGLAAVLAAYVYNQWAMWDYYRRLERRTHRNLQRMAGR